MAEQIYLTSDRNISCNCRAKSGCDEIDTTWGRKAGTIRSLVTYTTIYPLSIEDNVPIEFMVKSRNVVFQHGSRSALPSRSVFALTNSLHSGTSDIPPVGIKSMSGKPRTACESIFCYLTI